MLIFLNIVYIDTTLIIILLCNYNKYYLIIFHYTNIYIYIYIYTHIYIYIYTSSFGPVYMRIVENYELLLENCMI